MCQHPSVQRNTTWDAYTEVNSESFIIDRTLEFKTLHMKLGQAIFRLLDTEVVVLQILTEFTDENPDVTDSVNPNTTHFEPPRSFTTRTDPDYHSKLQMMKASAQFQSGHYIESWHMRMQHPSIQKQLMTSQSDKDISKIDQTNGNAIKFRHDKGRTLTFQK